LNAVAMPNAATEISDVPIAKTSGMSVAISRREPPESRRLCQKSRHETDAGAVKQQPWR